MTIRELSAVRPDPGIDLRWLLDLVGNDREFLVQILDLFDRDVDRWVVQIREAADRLDGDALERSTHGLKGLLCQFGESAALDRCRRLNALALDNEPAEGEIDALAKEVDQIRHDLARLAR